MEKKGATMAEIIKISDYKIKSREKKAFAPWKKRFKEDFDFFTRLSDLSDRVVHRLAKEGQASETPLREIVMAVLDLGPASKFPFLSNEERWFVAHRIMFLKTQVFFEIMLRIGWIAEYPCQRYSLTSIVENRGKDSEFLNRALPVLSDSLQKSSEYEKLSPELRKKFLEERFDRALTLFEKKIKHNRDR